MKTIGLLGGMSWESTAIYYRVINELVQERLGGLHSADLLLRSIDFAGMAQLQAEGDWEEAAARLCEDARRLEAAGAELVLLCTNTMHRVAPQVEAALGVPFIHIGDATAQVAVRSGFSRLGLLGTSFTMTETFYRERFLARGLTVMVPPEADRIPIHNIIFDELCRGVVSPLSRVIFRDAIHDLAARGAEAVILGCTEIGLLISESDVELPLLDTTRIHATAGVDAALGQS
ncbi:MAG: aspartate/glutamate racemase family protein [Pseudomonadota bacterium]